MEYEGELIVEYVRDGSFIRKMQHLKIKAKVATDAQGNVTAEVPPLNMNMMPAGLAQGEIVCAECKGPLTVENNIDLKRQNTKGFFVCENCFKEIEN